MWYTHTMKYYLAINQQWNNAICSHMDGPRDDHTKWSKLERKRPIPYDITFCDTNELIYEIETEPQT